MKKKVLFIIWTFTAGGGAEKILANITNNLDFNKYDIDILEFHNFNIRKEESNSNIRLLKPILTEKRRAIPLNIVHKFYSKIVYFAAKRYPKIINEIFIRNEYDAIIGFNYLIPSFLAAFGKSSKKYCWVHSSIEDLDYNSMENEKKVLFLNNMQEKAFNKIDKIIAISNVTERSILNLYPNLDSKIKRIYNGYDFKNVINLSREKINLDGGYEYLIIGVGRLVRQKNFSLLIDVANELKNNNINFKLIIIGDGEEREKLNIRVKEYGIEDVVELKGYINNPYPYFKAADLFCLTSEAEGFPTVIVESMLLGCPFVSTNVAGVDELSNNEECGIITKSDYKEISKKIINLLKDKNKRMDMSKKCIEKAKEYSIERQVNEVEMLLE